MKPSIGKVENTARGRVGLSVEGLIRGRLCVSAMSGGGKGWALTRLLEQTHPHVQQIVIDPEGEWYTLRKDFDYLLAGPGGDCEATPRSAKLLARSLMESKVSAILDISDLGPADQDSFVRNFLNGLMALRTKLWSPLLVVIDEAQRFAPQNGKAESLAAVNKLMSGGRKRGFAGVLVTQRLPMLSKDSVAQCASVLVGRAVMDIDVNRAAETMGFSKSGPKAQALKRFQDGEFHFFGPAFETVELDGTQTTLKVGPTKTKPIQIGKPAPPHPPTPKAIAKIAAGLADLPERAHAEIVDLVQAKSRIRELEKMVDEKPKPEREPIDQEMVESLIRQGDERGFERGHMEGVASGFDEGRATAFEQVSDQALGYISTAINTIDTSLSALTLSVGNLKAASDRVSSAAGKTSGVVLGRGNGKAERRNPGEKDSRAINSAPSKQVRSNPSQRPSPSDNGELKKVTPSERRFLEAMARLEHARIPSPWTKNQISFLAGRSTKSSTTGNLFGSLRSKGMIEYLENGVAFTTAGAVEVGPHAGTGGPIDIVASVNELLGKCERALFEQLVEAYPKTATKDAIALAADYSPTSSTASNGFGRLKGLQIITYPAKGSARVSDWLFPEAR